MITFEKVNEAYSRIKCDSGILYTLADKYSVFVDGYRFMPKFKARQWDGKLRFINKMTGEMYTGLIPNVIKSLKEMDEPEISYQGYKSHNKMYTKDEVASRLSQMNLPYPLYDYQITAIETALTSQRKIIVSSTSSGKSLIIYCIIRILIEDGFKIALTVSNIMLANQMYSDFKSYSTEEEFNVVELVHVSAEGRDRYSEKPLIISTWQAINELKTTEFKEYMAQFDAILSDEVHECASKTMKTIMENATNAYIRLGFTGTLDTKDEAKKLALTGLYGSSVVVKTARELIDEGRATPVKINCVVINHTEQDKKLVASMDYTKEIDFSISHEKRNKLIYNIAGNLKGNTLIIVRHIQKHAKPLKDLLEKHTDKTVILLDKDTPSELREDIRKSLENIDNTIIIATYKLVSTGVSIKRLHNIIFGCGVKKQNPVLQSIGRLLRLSEHKTHATLFDIVDNFEYNGIKNFSLEHFMERFNYYTNEGHDVNINTIDF